MDFAGNIMLWAMDNYKGIEDITHEQMVNSYWNEYFQSCTMHTPETGLEMPHETELQISTFDYDPSIDSLFAGGAFEC